MSQSHGGDWSWCSEHTTLTFDEVKSLAFCLHFFPSCLWNAQVRELLKCFHNFLLLKWSDSKCSSEELSRSNMC
jgi:hypothetical protein